MDWPLPEAGVRRNLHRKKHKYIGLPEADALPDGLESADAPCLVSRFRLFPAAARRCCHCPDLVQSFS